MLESYELDNGLKLFFINDNTKHSTYINLIVKFGGIDSNVYLNNKKVNIKGGCAHFLEHLVLECSEYGDLMNYFGNNGVKSNGITSLDRTIFYIDTVNKDINKYLEVLLYGIHNPIINEDNIKKIKGPILAEKRRSLDNRYSELYYTSINNMLYNSKFDSILGSLKDISSINQNDIKTAYNAFYRPNNEIIVIGGRFNKEKVLNTIKNIYNNINFNNNKISIKNNNKNIFKKQYITLKSDINIERSIISFKIPINTLSNTELINFDNYMYYFLRSNFGIVSKINQKLIKDDIILGNIVFNTMVLNGFYIINIESYIKNETLFNKNITDYLINKKYTFDKYLFELYKKNTILDYITREDNIYSKINPFIENIVTFNYYKLDSIEDITKLNFKEYKKTISNIDFSTYSICVLKRKN